METYWRDLVAVLAVVTVVAVIGLVAVVKTCVWAWRRWGGGR